MYTRKLWLLVQIACLLTFLGVYLLTKNIRGVIELILFVELRITNILLQENVFRDTQFQPLLTFKSLNTFRCSLIKLLIAREKELMRK